MNFAIFGVMNRHPFLRKFSAFVLLMAATLGAWDLVKPEITLRYRLTVAVEAGGRRFTGSSVRQVSYSYKILSFLNIDAPSDYPTVTRVDAGEALVIDMGGLGQLFATLRPTRAPEAKQLGRRFSSLNDQIVPVAWGERQVLYFEDMWRLRLLAGLVPLPLDMLPVLVRFRDLADPKTVEIVNPNDLSRDFGPGAKITGASVEIVSERITRGIENILPWLSGKRQGVFLTHPGKYIGAMEVRPEDMLHYSDFKK